MANIGPGDLDVIALHDCFSVNELLTYEALGLCDIGRGGHLSESGRITFGGDWVVSPSGGLVSNGHPLSAIGLAQCTELTWQLRANCGRRQAHDAHVALQHNLGLGGACMVAACTRV